MKPSGNENISSNDVKKGEINPFYNPPFPLASPKGKALLVALVMLYLDPQKINLIYNEMETALPPLNLAQTPDTLWYEVLKNLSTRTKLETFLKYLYTENINKQINELLLSIDSTLTRSPIVIDPPKKRYFLDPLKRKYFFVLAFLVVALVGYLLISLFVKPPSSYFYGNSVLREIIEGINDDPYINDPIIVKYDPKYNMDVLIFFYINGQFLFIPDKPELFFDKIYRANTCLHFTLTDKNLLVTLDDGKFNRESLFTNLPIVTKCK